MRSTPMTASCIASTATPAPSPSFADAVRARRRGPRASAGARRRHARADGPADGRRFRARRSVTLQRALSRAAQSGMDARVGLGRRRACRNGVRLGGFVRRRVRRAWPATPPRAAGREVATQLSEGFVDLSNGYQELAGDYVRFARQRYQASAESRDFLFMMVQHEDRRVTLAQVSKRDGRDHGRDRPRLATRSPSTRSTTSAASCSTTAPTRSSRAIASRRSASRSRSSSPGAIAAPRDALRCAPCAGHISWPQLSRSLGRPAAADPRDDIDAAIRDHAGLTGSLVLERGEQALLARAWLVDHARDSIEVQYFIWSTDNIGILASEALLRAAQRGVAVRVIVDDLLIDAPDKTLLALAQHRTSTSASTTRCTPSACRGTAGCGAR